eukprot:2525774-Alexandrium_andersonii.AAC.1
MVSLAIGSGVGAFRRARASWTSSEINCERRRCETHNNAGVGSMNFEACVAQERGGWQYEF